MVLISRSMPRVGLEDRDGDVLGCGDDEEKGDESQDNQLDELDDVGGEICVGAICEEVQSALVFLIASTVDGDDEANGLSFGRLFLSQACLVFSSTGHASAEAPAGMPG